MRINRWKAELSLQIDRVGNTPSGADHGVRSQGASQRVSLKPFPNEARETLVKRVSLTTRDFTVGRAKGSTDRRVNKRDILGLVDSDGVPNE